MHVGFVFYILLGMRVFILLAAFVSGSTLAAMPPVPAAWVQQQSTTVVPTGSAASAATTTAPPQMRVGNRRNLGCRRCLLMARAGHYRSVT